MNSTYMNYNLLLFLVISSIFASCNGNIFENTSNRKEYIEQISKLSDESRKKQLEKDADFITALLDSEIKDIQIYFSFSFGSGKNEYEEDIDTAQHFTLTPPDTLQFEFAQLNEVTAEQWYATPHSKFRIYSYQEFQNLDRRDINYTANSAFRNGKTISLEELGLQKADSVQITASYSYVTAFDMVEIDRTAEETIRYKEFEFEINKMNDQYIEMEVPGELNIVDYQAISRNGVLMDTKGHSIFPVFGLSPQIEKQLREMITVLTEAAQSSDKEACIAELEKIPDDNFIFIPLLVNFGKDFKKVEAMNDNDDSIIEVIRAYKEKYTEILGLKFYSAELNFPQPYTKILVYVAIDTQTVSREMVADCEELEESDAYRIFLDQDTKKYGIIDSVANIVIPATYNSLYHGGGLYFSETTDDDNTISYYLNETDKKFEKLPKNIKFRQMLDNGLVVFADKDNYEGVFVGNEKQIVPYLYDKITLNGKVLVARGSKRGRSFYDFYTLEGKKIDLPKVKDIDWEDGNPNTIICSTDKKYGLLDENGVVSIPMQYETLTFLDTNLLQYTVDKPISYSRPLSGIVNTKGQVITPPMFTNIYEFYKGYALVRMNYDYYLIDINGNIQHSFPADTYVDFEYDDEDMLYYETSTGQKYTYDGKLIKN